MDKGCMTRLVSIMKRRRGQGLVGDTDESWTPGMFFCCFLLFVTMHTAYRTENYGEDEWTPSCHVTSRVTSVTASAHRPQQQQQQSQQSMVSPPGLFFIFFFYSSPIFLSFSYNNLFDHLNVHDDYTSTPTLQPTSKATQHVETAIAAAAAALATGMLFFFGFYYYFH